MIPLSAPPAASHMHRFKTWIKKPYYWLFGRKTVRALPDLPDHFIHNRADEAHSQSLAGRTPFRVDPSTFMSLTASQNEQLANLGTELTSTLKEVALKGYQENNLELMKQLGRLKTNIKQRNWSAVHTMLQSDFEQKGVRSFSIYQRKIQAIAAPPQVPDRTQQAPPANAGLQQRRIAPPVELSQPLSVHSFSEGEINLFSGEISRINEVITPPIDTIVYPHPSDNQRIIDEVDSLTQLEPDLTERYLLKQVASLEPGYSMVTGAGKLSGIGINRIVHTVLPDSYTPDGTARLFNAYVSSIKKAHEYGAHRIAIPVLSSQMNLPLQSEAKIAHSAVAYFLKSLPSSVKPPSIYLTFPRSPMGNNRYRHHHQRIWQSL